MATNYKKKSNSITVLVVAIVIVLAAIGFVVYDEWSSHSALFESEAFATAVADALDTTPAALSEKKLSDVKYIELNYDAEAEKYYVALGKSDFAATYKDYMAKIDAGETDVALDIEGKFTDARFELEEGLTLSDLKYFTGLEIISAGNVPINDSSVFENMKALTHVYVSACGLTEVNGLAGLNSEAVYQVNLSGNNIEDWSALNYIEDKVVVSSTYSIEMAEDGSYTLVPMEQTLADLNKSEAEVEDEVNEETANEETTDTVDNTSEETPENAEEIVE